MSKENRDIQRDYIHTIALNICNYHGYKYGDCLKCPLYYEYEEDICYDDQNFDLNKFEEWLLKRISIQQK